MEFKGKKFSIVGGGKSGISAANLISRKGGDVLLSDLRREGELNLKNLNKNVQFVGGKNLIREGDIVILSPGVSPLSKIFKNAYKLGREVLGEIELFYRVVKNPIIAITGTDGKSTTTAWIGFCLGKCGFDFKVGGNIGNPLCDLVDELNEGTIVVAEVSSFQLITTKFFKPWIAVVTNIAEDHIDHHGNMKEYVEAKKNILKNLDKGGIFVQNIDDEVISKWQVSGGVKTIMVSQEKEIEEGVFFKDGKIFHKFKGMKNEIVSLDNIKIPGKHNIENALLTTAVCIASSADYEGIKKGLTEFEGLEHRIERVPAERNILFFNDSKATNPHSAIVALKTFEGKKPVLIAGGYDKGLSFTSLAMEIKKVCKGVILIGASRHRLADAIGSDFSIQFADSLKDAILKGAKMAGEGGIVLFSPACSSFDMFSSYEERGMEFKKIVKELFKCS